MSVHFDFTAGLIEGSSFVKKCNSLRRYMRYAFKIQNFIHIYVIMNLFNTNTHGCVYIKRLHLRNSNTQSKCKESQFFKPCICMVRVDEGGGPRLLLRLYSFTGGIKWLPS